MDLVENEKKHYDQVVSIGPMIMMKFVCLTTKKYDLPTTVSLNPIMVDGTGMCGACRVSIDGKTKFACVDGPEFDGHLVDFDSAMKRQRQYIDNKKTQTIADHHCTMDLAVSDHKAETSLKDNQDFEIKRLKTGSQKFQLLSKHLMRETKTSRKFALATLPKKQLQKLQDVLTVRNLAVLKAAQFPLTYLAS